MKVAVDGIGSVDRIRVPIAINKKWIRLSNRTKHHHFKNMKNKIIN
jgi:hypothetical protein